MTLEPRVFSVEIPASAEELEGGGRQADIVLDGLEQAGNSFQLRMFLNDPQANADTEPSSHPGYAGAIHVYGYGGMLPGGEQEDAAAPRMPMRRRRIATEAIHAAAAKGQQMTVTLVPVGYGASEPDVKLDGVRVSVLVH